MKVVVEQKSELSLSQFFSAAITTANPNALAKMSIAATAAMREAGNLLKVGGRQAIKSGGLGAKFANAWRVGTYPKKGVSLDPAAFGHHNIPYSLIFQTGGVIRGHHGLLWLPLPTVPKVGKRIARPRDLTGVKLFSFMSAKGTPLLAAKIRNAGANKSSRIRGQVSLPALRAGTDAAKIRGTAKLRGKQKGGVKAANAGANVVTVPLFHGVPSVTLRRRFNMDEVAKKVSALIPGLYDKRMPEG